jgi:23S rRNA U2552 (ribose-2'-O)-methylase RlmE/FtsJ
MEYKIEYEDINEIDWKNEGKIKEVTEYKEILNKDWKMLNEYRDKIDIIDIEEWKKIRWYINYYDFIVKDPIINRAFYKCWEIIETYKLINKETQVVLSLAEAPGGFIQSINTYIKRNCMRAVLENSIEKVDVDIDGFEVVKKKNKTKKSSKPKIYTMSLNRNISTNLPTYNSRIIENNVKIYKGEDLTGNIYNLASCDKLLEYIGESVDCITADGGFDEGDEYNNKEQLHYKLILYEIYYCLNNQKNGGSCIIKFFDIFTESTIQMLYILSKSYKNVYIYKPYTSRPTNSEKYVICSGYLGKTSIKTRLREYISEYSKRSTSNRIIFDIINVPKKFSEEIKEMNKRFVNSQCDALKSALSITSDVYIKTLKEIVKKKETKYNSWIKDFRLS